MTEEIFHDLSTLLSVSVDVMGELGQQDRARAHVADALRSDPDAVIPYRVASLFEHRFVGSWIHSRGDTLPYLSLEIAADSLPIDTHRELLASVVLSESPSIPYDYRAIAADELNRIGFGRFVTDLRQVATEDIPFTRRTLREKLTVPTDGVDHVFDIPGTAEERLRLIDAVARAKTRETRKLLATRLLNADIASHSTKVAAEKYISVDVGSDIVKPADYLVQWDQEFTVDGRALTTAEILRIVLLSPEFTFPDITVRPKLVDFYKAVLRVSGRSIIGLGAGIFHVEHGTVTTPSYFYMGRDVIIGKGCIIDCVGGAVLQQGSFLGGGFIPILIHTHKHLRRPDEDGSAERKRILAALFLAETGARFPMGAVGLFETADYLDKPSPYAGISAIPVDNL